MSHPMKIVGQPFDLATFATFLFASRAGFEPAASQFIRPSALPLSYRPMHAEMIIETLIEFITKAMYKA